MFVGWQKVDAGLVTAIVRGDVLVKAATDAGAASGPPGRLIGVHVIPRLRQSRKDLPDAETQVGAMFPARSPNSVLQLTGLPASSAGRRSQPSRYLVKSKSLWERFSVRPRSMGLRPLSMPGSRFVNGATATGCAIRSRQSTPLG